MNARKFKGQGFAALAITCLLGGQFAQAATTMYFLDGVTGLTVADAEVTPTAPTHSGATDYSDAGLNLGNDGFVFFNWDAPAPTQGVYNFPDTITQNINDQLPAWLSFDYDPSSANYSFGDDPGEETFAKGGEASWATLTLPDGDNGLSGALVDPRAAGNSNNTFNSLVVGAGAPSSFWISFVTDNTNGEHDPDARFRPREDADGANVRLNNIPSLDGAPDVYSILYSDIVVGDVLKLQLRSGSTLEAPSIAGFMVDTVIPEPTSAALLMLGGLGLIARRRRR